MIKFKMIAKENKNLVNNIIGAFIVRGGSLVVSLFTMPAYLRYFENQEVLGLWFTLLSVLNWVFMFDMGLGNGLRNKLPITMTESDGKKTQQYISSTYISMSILVFILCAICLSIFQYIPWNNLLSIDLSLISHKTLVLSVKIVFMGILIQFLFKLITSILYAIQKSAIVNLLSLLSNIMILIFVSNAQPLTLEHSLITMSWINVIAVNIPLLIVTVIVFKTTLKGYRPRFKYYNKKFAVEVFKSGSTLLWLSIVFMVTSSTNEFLISHLTNSAAVVEYQVYYKIFNAVSSVFTLALAPIWSAVTKAQAEKNYTWIKKLSNVLLLMTGVALVIQLAIVPIFQQLVNLWLGTSTIIVNTEYALVFAIFNTLIVLHNVNTSLSNGVSYFKTQIIWMTFAAIVNIPLAYLFVQLTGGWIGVILANIISLLPYEIIAPIYFNKYINRSEKLDNSIEVYTQHRIPKSVDQ